MFFKAIAFQTVKIMIKSKGFILAILLGTILVSSCENKVPTFGNRDKSKVDLRLENGKWNLYRNNQPYYVKGAHGSVALDLLKEIGGNSIIVYDNELSDSLLNLADSLGISVSVTLDLGKARFKENDYRDKKFVMAQRKRMEEVVRKYYQHPAILFWIIGNELNLAARVNIPMWKEVNEISKMIHAIDPYHLTTTAIAEFPTDRFHPLIIKLFAPDLDFFSLTIYEFAPRIKREMNSFIWGSDRPFLVTEWAGIGWWRYTNTEWYALVEPSSTAKAPLFNHYQWIIFNQDKENNLGGYVFYWGAKQERTPTAFSLILDSKYKVQATETLQYLWTGSYPDNYCPRIDTFYIDGFPSGNHYLLPDSIYSAQIVAHDPEKEPLYFKWELRTEGYYRGKTGGEAERITDIISGSDAFLPYSQKFTFETPKEKGEYRLFVYIYDNHNYVATANIPIYVLE
jgi:hypothetical protein